MGLSLGGKILTFTTHTDRASFHQTLRPGLHNIAARLRIACIRSTTKAGSGHITSCCSAADIMSVLFFAVMRHDPQRPDYAGNDRFILSKGHAAPLLYAAWAEAGFLRQDNWAEIRGGKVPDLNGSLTQRLPLDTLYSLLADADFEKHQEEMDGQIARHIRR